jgi:hypothetical protein
MSSDAETQNAVPYFILSQTDQIVKPRHLETAILNMALLAENYQAS